MKKTNLRIISTIISMVLMLSVCAMGTVHGVIDLDTMIKDGENYDMMMEYLTPYYYGEEPVFGMFEAYAHYSENESTPDYFVVEILSTATGTKNYFELDGYYIYCYNPMYYESPLTYYVIDNKTKEIIPLVDAFAASKDEYYPFLTDSGYEKITRIGDVNRDKALDIKDVTDIQRCLAGIESFDDYVDELFPFDEKQYGKWERYVSDFNRDGKRNIKDATAIQKHIVGLEY